MSDPTQLVATHEAAHAVAAYVHRHPIETLQAWPTDGKMRHLTPRIQDRVDGFGLAQIALAGEAFTDFLGLSKFNASDADKENAVRAILVSAPEDAPLSNVQAALSIVEEATRSLVESERFTNLALALSSELAEKHFMIGSEIERFLRDHDPATPRPFIPFVRHHRGANHNPDCIVCDAYPGWWRAAA